MLRAILRCCDYLFILRPTLFFPVWTVFAAGFLAAIRFTSATYSAQPWLSGLALTLLMGSAFIINQIADRDIDRENDKLFLIANGLVPVKQAVWQAAVLAAAALVLALSVNWALLLLFVAIFAVTGIGYSIAPFKWKDGALSGLVANALGGWLIFIAGWRATEAAPAPAALHALPYAAAVAAVYLYTTLLDVRGDQRFGKQTFAVRFGDRAALWSGTALLVAALITAAWLRDLLILVPVALALPLFAAAAWRQRAVDVSRAIKLPMLFLALGVSWHWPLFFLLILATFMAARVYYANRFNLKYPTFGADRVPPA